MERFLLLSMFSLLLSFTATGNNCPVVSEAEQSFCESEGTGNEFHHPKISDLMAVDGGDGLRWYASADAGEPLAWEELLADGATYYAGNDTGDCSERAAVTVSILDAPNAGRTTFFNTCASADPVDLLEVFAPSLLGSPDAGGTFDPPLASGTTIFDPSLDTAGRYRYTVASTTSCPDDFAFIYINLGSAPNAGENVHLGLGAIEGPTDLFDLLTGEPDAGGTWSPELSGGNGVFVPGEDAPGVYTYTVSLPGCGEAQATVTIGSQQDPEICPVIVDAIQTFCESEGTGNNFHAPRIGDLLAEDAGGGISWYASAEAQEPLPEDHLLEDGMSYYADNAFGNCSGRPAVSVSILDAPNAGSTTFVTFCSDGDPVDLLEVFKPSLLGPPDAGGEIIPALASGTTVFDPAVDQARRYRYVVSSGTSCPDDNAFIYVNLSEAPDAGGDSNVLLGTLEGPTDLFGLLGGTPQEGGTWSPELSGGAGIFVPGVDPPGGYTYSISGSQYCEEAQATVTIGGQQDPEACPVIAEDVQVFCESEGTGNNFYRPTVSHLAVASGEESLVWYASAQGQESLDPGHILEDGVTYYAGNASGGCFPRPSVSVNLHDSPNAGRTTFISLCSNDEPVDLLELIQSSVLGAPDAGGTFNPPLASGTSIFDPAVDVAGRYTYTVGSTSDCPDDRSFCTITIIEAPDAGEDGMVELTSGDEPVALLDHLNGTPEPGGQWSPALADGEHFDPSMDEEGVYTYTVGAGNCLSSARVEVRINDVQAIQIFPNPSDGHFNFASSSPINSISIFNLNGRVLGNYDLKSADSEKAQVDLQSLRPGVYLVRIQSRDGITTKRIIKK